MIDSFREEYYFLSNFYHVDVEYDGIVYKNTEAAFQAQKVLDDNEKLLFSDLYPREAKKLGRRVKLRKDWNDVKDNYMYEICKAKFTQHEDLAEKLLETGDEELVEGNTWNDTYWGVCNGKGKNQLGKTLMRIREELRS
ncbi:NADAR family protein [uncultured Methanobrevibacter sp.]|uniref:NADAR family protein n=1 Tax=uncultured Methanobrevibacter sp. TaxID=253161 RepID=UPI0025D28E56|nr:NADAR family protein [uncultured Methanobrevibacter sp.]